MAGGKETPRQKMIGMMYLVLLALLALQMGQEILMKFRQLEESLGIAVYEATKKNIGVVGKIAASVKEGGGKQDDVLKMSEALRAKTSEVLASIDEIKKGLIEATEGYQEDGKTYAGMKDTDKSSTFLVGEGDKNNGKGYELQKILNDYVDFVNQLEVKVSKIDLTQPVTHQKLALDAKDDPLFKDNKEKATYDFAHINFDHTEMIASMAYLTERQSRVANLESDLQNKIAALVGAADFKFDNVFAMAKPKSEVVAAGTYYEAELFVSASSQAIKPKMESSAGPVTMDGNKGKIKFKASAGAYDKEGIVEKSWEGRITIKKPIGSGDTTLKVVTKYKVAKPVIQVQAGAVAALYRNCANDLQINVPALGAEYRPTFSVTGGDKIVGAKVGQLIVFPSANSRKVSITVTNDGTAIGTEDFQTKPIPKPEIQVLTDGRAMNEKTGADAPGPRAFQIQVVPDQAFKDALPREATYAATKWSVTLVRGRKPAQPTQTFTSSKGDVSNLRANAKSGDRYVVEVVDVVRRTSRGQYEAVSIGTVVKNLPLN